MTTKAEIDEFVAQKAIALVGASRSPKKFGNTLLRELRKKGFTLRVVHPTVDRIEGEPCVRSLAEVANIVDGVVINVAPKAVPALLEGAAAAGIRRVWLQPGSESEAALSLGNQLGLTVIHHHCLLMFAQPSGPHAFHHFIVKLLRRLPQ